MTERRSGGAQSHVGGQHRPMTAGGEFQGVESGVVGGRVFTLVGSVEGSGVEGDRTDRTQDTRGRKSEASTQ